MLAPDPGTQCHRLHPRAIAWDLRQFAIDVIAHPDGEINVHDQDRCDYNEKQPKPPTFDQPFHYGAYAWGKLQRQYLKNAPETAVGCEFLSECAHAISLQC